MDHALLNYTCLSTFCVYQFLLYALFLPLSLHALPGNAVNDNFLCFKEYTYFLLPLVCIFVFLHIHI